MQNVDFLSFNLLCRGPICYDLDFKVSDLDLVRPYDLDDILQILNFEKDKCIYTKTNYTHFIRSTIANYQTPLLIELKCSNQEYIYANHHGEFVKHSSSNFRDTTVYFVCAKYDKKDLFFLPYENTSIDYIKMPWRDLPIFIESAMCYDERVLKLFSDKTGN
jgi:hypothetical protein